MIIFLSFFIFLIKSEILGIDYSDEVRTSLSLRSRRVVYKINGSLSIPTILDLKRMLPTKSLSYFTLEDLSDIFYLESKDLTEKVPYLIIFEKNKNIFKIPNLESHLNLSALNYLFVKNLNLQNNKFKCVLSKRSYLSKEQTQQLFQSFHKADYKVIMVVPETLCFLSDYISSLPIEAEEVKEGNEGEKEGNEEKNSEEKDKEDLHKKVEGRNYLVVSTRGVKTVFSMYLVKKTEKEVNFKNLFHVESEDFSDKIIKSTLYSIVEDITVTSFKKEFEESKGPSVEMPTLICYPRNKGVTLENDNLLFCDLSKIIKKIIEGIIRDDDIYKPLDIKTYNLNNEVKFVLFNTTFDLKEIKNILCKIILEKKEVFKSIKEDVNSKIEGKEYKTLFCSNFVEMKIFQQIFPFDFESKYTNQDSISFGAAYLAEKNVKIQDDRILYPTADSLFNKENKVIENVIKEIKTRHEFESALEKLEGQNLLKNFSEFSETEIGEIIEKAKKQFSNLKEIEEFISLIKNKIEENSKRIREKERKIKEIERRDEGVKQLENLILDFERENLFVDLEKKEDELRVNDSIPGEETSNNTDTDNTDNKDIPNTKDTASIGSEHLIELRDVFVSVKTWYENNKENKEIGHSEFLNQFVTLKSKHRIITSRIQRIKEENEKLEKEKEEKKKEEKEKLEGKKEELECKDTVKDKKEEKEKEELECEDTVKDEKDLIQDNTTLPSEENSNDVSPPSFDEKPSFEKTDL